MTKVKQNKIVVLTGEGLHQHVLTGDVCELTEKNAINKPRVFEIKGDGLLRHETLEGEIAEHNTLIIKEERVYTGRQVEYNPLKQMWSIIRD